MDIRLISGLKKGPWVGLGMGILAAEEAAVVDEEGRTQTGQMRTTTAKTMEMMDRGPTSPRTSTPSAQTTAATTTTTTTAGLPAHSARAAASASMRATSSEAVTVIVVGTTASALECPRTENGAAKDSAVSSAAQARRLSPSRAPGICRVRASASRYSHLRRIDHGGGGAT